MQIGGLSSTNGLKVTVAGADRTSAFAKRGSGKILGLVRDLKLGQSTITARVGDRAAQLTVTNHPQGGPVFSGPQLAPWKCQATAKDAKCNQPPKFTYVYKSTSQSGFQAYDPANPPSDVATTKTDNGHTVPFIVRVETGYIDRDQYQIAALFQPGKPWSATAPQPQFDHKLLIHHGASCGADHQTGTAPGVTNAEAEQALGLGFATMSNALDNAGHNCNLASEAESVIMTKEYLIDHYGTLRYTIGTGCSGGSLAEQWIANAYPGVYQGIMPTCSFGRVEHRVAVPGLPPNSALLPEPGPVGCRRNVDSDSDVRGRGRSHRRRHQRAGLRHRSVPRRDPDRSVRRDQRPAALRAHDQPGRRAL